MTFHVVISPAGIKMSWNLNILLPDRKLVSKFDDIVVVRSQEEEIKI
jgi:hypothetical protein